MVLASHYGLPRTEIEFQMLYGLGDPIKRAVVRLGYRVRAYMPVGSYIRGMKYSARRLHELANKDNALTRTMRGDYEFLSQLRQKPQFHEIDLMQDQIRIRILEEKDLKFVSLKSMKINPHVLARAKELWEKGSIDDRRKVISAVSEILSRDQISFEDMTDREKWALLKTRKPRAFVFDVGGTISSGFDSKIETKILDHIGLLLSRGYPVAVITGGKLSDDIVWAISQRTGRLT
jgi:hypothetical protein